jgi:hypothetical protein
MIASPLADDPGLRPPAARLRHDRVAFGPVRRPAANLDDGGVARRRGQETVRDMLLSLGVVMAGVLVFAVFVMPRGDREPAVKVVDTTVPVASFAGQAPFDLLAPRGLPAAWKPTSVRARTPSGGTSDADVAELTIGFVVDEPDDQRYAVFAASNAPDVVQRLLGDRPITDSRVVDGVSWDERRADSGHLAFTRKVGGATFLVEDGGGTGGAGVDDLVRLAASLRPVG